MKKLIKIFILTGLTLTLNSCQSQSQPSRLTPNEFEKVISKSNVQLIDIRTPAEFSRGHIKNAKNIDFYSDNFKDQVSKLDKTKALYIYCASGNRSGQALKQLSNLSFRELGDLQGGINLWNQEKKGIIN